MLRIYYQQIEHKLSIIQNFSYIFVEMGILRYLSNT